MTAINYEQLTDEEALEIIKNENNDVPERDIESAVDVFWYLEEYDFTDLDDAIRLQRWDKELPKLLHRGLLESKRNIQEATECHNIADNALRCPSCDDKMYQFECPTSDGYSQTEWVHGCGGLVGDNITFVSNPDGYVWNANEKENHAPILCSYCSRDIFHKAEKAYLTSVFLGDTDEKYEFAIIGNLVVWDYYNSISVDLNSLPEGGNSLLEQMAKNKRDEWLDENNWVAMTPDIINNKTNIVPTKYRAAKRAYKEIVNGWIDEETTHPQLDFSYIIDEQRYDAPTIMCAEEHEDSLIDVLVSQIEDKIADN